MSTFGFQRVIECQLFELRSRRSVNFGWSWLDNLRMFITNQSVNFRFSKRNYASTAAEFGEKSWTLTPPNSYFLTEFGQSDGPWPLQTVAFWLNSAKSHWPWPLQTADFLLNSAPQTPSALVFTSHLLDLSISLSQYSESKNEPLGWPVCMARVQKVDTQVWFENWKLTL